MSGERGGSAHRLEDWQRFERISFGIALAIALLPIPIALVIAWALGDPPWQHRPARDEARSAPAAHDWPGPPTDPGHH